MSHINRLSSISAISCQRLPSSYFAIIPLFSPRLSLIIKLHEAPVLTLSSIHINIYRFLWHYCPKKQKKNTDRQGRSGGKTHIPIGIKLSARQGNRVLKISAPASEFSDQHRTLSSRPRYFPWPMPPFQNFPSNASRLTQPTAKCKYTPTPNRQKNIKLS